MMYGTRTSNKLDRQHHLCQRGGIDIDRSLLHHHYYHQDDKADAEAGVCQHR